MVGEPRMPTRSTMRSRPERRSLIPRPGESACGGRGPGSAAKASEKHVTYLTLPSSAPAPSSSRLRRG